MPRLPYLTMECKFERDKGKRDHYFGADAYSTDPQAPDGAWHLLQPKGTDLQATYAQKKRTRANTSTSPNTKRKKSTG